VDDALTDANLQAQHIHKVVLVGGATRTPLVHRLLSSRMGRPVHAEIEPDLAVALGAAVQAGLIAGVDVGPVLVDITPHTLGIETLGERHGLPWKHCFSPIIERNTPLPAVRTEIYSTVYDNQDAAQIRVFQGEDEDTRLSHLVGEFNIQGLAAVPAPNEILVRLELDLSGILRVTATERDTGLAKRVVIDNMMERFRQRSRVDALDRIEGLFGGSAADEEDVAAEELAGREWGRDDLAEEALPGTVSLAGDELNEVFDPDLREAICEAQALLARSDSLQADASSEDAAELKALAVDLKAAVGRRSLEEIRGVMAQIEDIVFYLEDR
jgi:molecular chaperone DnaK